MDGKIKMLINKLDDIANAIYNIDDYRLHEINARKEKIRDEIYSVMREVGTLEIVK